jgi:large subunit ribosomal protein L35
VPGLNFDPVTTAARRSDLMPKLKSKSGAKKRFRATGSGKVRANYAFKRHNLRKRSTKMKRTARYGFILSKQDENIVRKFLPYL